MRKAFPIGFSLAASALGILIAWVDSRPTWDDTGITAGAVFLTAALFGALRPSRVLVWAVAVGVWIPLFGIALHHNPGSLLALAPAFLGSYAGALARRAISPDDAKR
ncbi:MAG: hypothetical protein H6P95_680 [Candidatus Aminicenantes bacterium]|jgi:hypothetical protein|nr:hypothetical protein [Candidatus Aminicenantes bacterium]